MHRLRQIVQLRHHVIKRLATVSDALAVGLWLARPDTLGASHQAASAEQIQALQPAPLQASSALSVCGADRQNLRGIPTTVSSARWVDAPDCVH